MDKHDFVNRVFTREWCIENLVAPNFERTNIGDTLVEVLISDSRHLEILGHFIEARLALHNLKPTYKVSSPANIQKIINLCCQISESEYQENPTKSMEPNSAMNKLRAKSRFSWKPSVLEIGAIAVGLVIALFAITRNPGAYVNDVGEKYELQRKTISKRKWSPSDHEAKMWQSHHTIIGLGGQSPMSDEIMNDYRLKQKALESVASAKIIKTDINGEKEILYVNYICLAPAYASNPSQEVLRLREIDELLNHRGSLGLDDEYDERLREQLCG